VTYLSCALFIVLQNKIREKEKEKENQKRKENKIK